ncbi:NifU family protein [Cesiribacter andamanensis]|uniref:Fe/S biogenesis protein nfuA n=1 Tax=Cesiribacter andamanensis AMV16 TaxID=1279009 RepID=M7NTS9_9BACT|nr:NifU family protein [Cesiribacter andamanensis]EMR01874.1 Fe/S biogenesis protein nfuA [Cesiribacter andamanensis AMV16]
MEQTDLYHAVEQALEGIRPYLEADGGNVKVLEITDEKVVRLELLGACGSCPMSAMTFRAGIEEAIRREVPQVSAVQAVNLTPAGVR